MSEFELLTLMGEHTEIMVSLLHWPLAGSTGSSVFDWQALDCPGRISCRCPLYRLHFVCFLQCRMPIEGVWTKFFSHTDRLKIAPGRDQWHRPRSNLD